MSSTKRRRKRTTEEQKKFIVENYLRMNPREIADRLGVELQTVYKYGSKNMKGSRRPYESARVIGGIFTDEQRQKIAEMAKLGIKAPTIAKTIGACATTVYSYLSYLRQNPEFAGSSAFICTPPDSCFNCPFDDCIRGLSQVRQTKRELQFQAMCGIDTVRHRNGG